MPNKRMNTIPSEITVAEPSLEQRVGAAMFIIGFGVADSGIRTKAQLMHPHREFSDEAVLKESITLLSRVHSLQLQALPPHEKSKILTEQAERLGL